MRPAPGIVIDTNVLISSLISPFGESSDILALIFRKEVVSFTSLEILAEVLLILTRSGVADVVPGADTSTLLELFRSHSYIVKPSLRIQAVREDPSDDKFIECAVAANAEYLISNDKHVLALKRYKNIVILTSRAFLETCRKNEKKKDYFPL